MIGGREREPERVAVREGEERREAEEAGEREVGETE